MRIPVLALLPALSLLAPGAARAQDEEGPAKFALSYGVALTSEYISDGEQQSDGKPALQPYVEASYGMFYGGVWASNVDFGEGDDDWLEVDLYAGIRQEFGKLSLDLGYLRYLYEPSGDCCGDIQLLADYALRDDFGLSGQVKWDPVGDTVWTQVGAGYSFGELWSVSSYVGTDFGTKDLGDRDKVAMEVDLRRSIGDHAWAQIGYADSNYFAESLVLTVGADF